MQDSIKKYLANSMYSEKAKYEIKLLKVVRKLHVTADDFKKRVEEITMKAIDDALNDTNSGMYEFVELIYDGQTPKTIKIKSEGINIDVHFPRTTNIKYFDRESDEIDETSVIDSSNFNLIKLHQQNKNLVF